jgi:tripeptide aminopeptidase
LLGADDKAGIAEIMTTIQILQDKNIAHGQIEIIFSPDEETGHGMDNVPLDWLESKQCYTVDGGDLGEIEAECFNAYKSEITFTGKALHTGSARPNMVNAVTMASKFVSMLPQNESPEATDGYLGFYAPMEISGSMESATVTVFLRDFEDSGMNRRIETVDSLAQTCKSLFPNGNVEVKHTFQYKNMKQVLDKNPHVMQNLIEAVKNVGIEPVIRSIRGGTDGSRLSELGIPTPNIFTGGHNFHSRTEWACLEQMEYSVKTILELIKIYSERKN